MQGRERGLYESIVTEALKGETAKLDGRLQVRCEELRAAEAADRIALHLGAIVRRAVAAIADDKRKRVGIELARALCQGVASAVPNSEADADAPIPAGQVLRAILTRNPDGNPEKIAEPLIPLLDTTLLTNAPGEPHVGRQLCAEVDSADRIDVVMAFIRLSGIRPLREALHRHCERKRDLRILTTTYTGSTEPEALAVLQRLGAEVRVSYDVSTTRLHAKTWLFHRRSGFSTAYIGSSNLTHSAQVTGLEWNVRVSAARNPEVVDKVAAVFESYWNSGDFAPFAPDEFAEASRRASDRAPATRLSPLELRPYPFQERLLERLQLSRRDGYHRNLLVAATGTGKTVMAAVDYVRVRETLPRARLLFVAHRREILQQSLDTFRHAVRDAAFGELWVGGRRPTRFEHVFASIQSLAATGLADLDPDHFDVVIIDEFHHAAAPTYRALLAHVRPRELLGLTATPERSDNLPILHWFDDRIAAELRLWDAIHQHRLTPFHYFGVADGLDLREIPWRRGRGYDPTALTNLLTANDVWANLVLAQVRRHVDDCGRMRALGYCVSVAHARYMAEVFLRAGIAAAAIWADTPDEERERALRRLQAGDLNVLFSVDLFNEGVDVPAVDTLLFLRPTDSPTLFLQQLGRGLRHSEGKLACTVLDFVGQHRREFRFDRRFAALLGGSRKDVEEQIQRGFPFLPAGCHMQLDAVASELVLENIRRSLPTKLSTMADELRVLANAADEPVTLAHFLDQARLTLEDLYTGTDGWSWSDLREKAGLDVSAAGPHEKVLRRACGRLLHIDDRLRIDTYRDLLRSDSPPSTDALGTFDTRLVRMLVASVVDMVPQAKRLDLDAGCQILWQHRQIRAELLELLDVLAARIEHLPHALPSHPETPLTVHARYTRIEILSAFGVGDGAKAPSWQTGVRWVEGARSILLAFTLDKTTGQFSPTTRYRDYAISRELIHWESQSFTRADSPMGRRYRHHVEQGSSVMLFARLRSDHRAFWFLGPATYVSHESECPMAVTWRLDHPL
ncbi:MAG TPA: DUF3427 domain-containing protein, partial [bacterium]|nr:DUF3427 domain-containing protein [bacterium]